MPTKQVRSHNIVEKNKNCPNRKEDNWRNYKFDKLSSMMGKVLKIIKQYISELLDKDASINK